MLSREAEFSNVPLVALIELGQEPQLAGRFAAATARRTAHKTFTLSTADARMSQLPLGEELVSQLKKLVQRRHTDSDECLVLEP